MQFNRQLAFTRACRTVCRLGAPLILMASLFASPSFASDPLKTPSKKISKPESSALLALSNMGDKLISAGERGHVIVSADNGENWEQQSLPVSVSLTDAVFFDEQIGWLTGHDGVVLKTENAGETWTLVLDGLQLNQLVADQLTQIERDLQVRLAQSEDKDQIEKLGFLLGELRYALRDTNDAIDNQWTRPLFTIAVIDERTVLIGGAFGTLIKTSDGGASWQAMMAETKNPQGLHFYDLFVADEAIYLAGEYGLLRRSIDAGDTWEEIASPYEGTFFGVRVANDLVVAYGLQGTAYAKDQTGEKWRFLDLPTTAGIVDMTYLSNGNMVFLANDGSVYLTDAEGNQAERLDTDVEGAAALHLSQRALWLAGLNGLQRLELFGLNTL